MTWTVLRWVWRLEAPLFVGVPPAGALNRCRLYLPARAMHGAVTAELARLNGEEKSKFPDYGKFGKEVGENCRFTYLYPAEMNGEGPLVWLPTYMSAQHKQHDCNKNKEQRIGLIWRSMDGKRELSDRDFRRRLLHSRPATAIAPESDSASEGTLRETECINPWWRDVSGACTEPKHVLLFGYAFLKKNGFWKQLNNIDTLFVGGDTRYGLGKICRVELTEVSGDSHVFGHQVLLDKQQPVIQSDIVWGHALDGGQSQIQGMQGVKELPGGWDQGSPWIGALTWAPGSFCQESTYWAIDTYGCWIHQNKR